MYLHVGNEFVINSDDIIGIFDMDNTTVSRQGKRFLPESQDKGLIINATEDLPKSYTVTRDGGGVKIYISSYTTHVLARRANQL